MRCNFYTSDLIRKIDSSYDLIDYNYVDVSSSCYEANNYNSIDIYNYESLTEDIELGCFEKHTKGIGSKIFHKLDFDGRDLEKNCRGVHKPIPIFVRSNGPSYEGQKTNEVIEFVKVETLIIGRSSTNRKCNKSSA